MQAVVLVGLWAAGKTSFYHMHFAITPIHLNRDSLQTRCRERRLLDECLASDLSFMADTMNLQVAQRAIHRGWP